MIGTRHEEYGQFIDGLPFVLYTDLKRSRFNLSKDNNWHENLEIQICTEGCGIVLLNGEKISFNKNDIIAVNSNVLHYTGTDTHLTYSCLIVSTDFCRRVGLDPNFTFFEPLIKNSGLVKLFEDLTKIHADFSASCRTAKLNKTVLEILIELAENHTVAENTQRIETKKFEIVKEAIFYIRAHYSRKLTLDEISGAVLYDKYALCREFKKLTGQTIIENLNSYRCIKAIELLSSGYTVGETASLCGFDNLSFFTQTFKKYMGKLPSEFKK